MPGHSLYSEAEVAVWSLKRSMVGLVVENMRTSLEFYCPLELDLLSAQLSQGHTGIGLKLRVDVLADLIKKPSSS